MSKAAAKDHRAPKPWHYGAFLLFMIALFATLLSMTSCSTPREVIRWQRDTTYIEKMQVDSVFKRDSVYIRERGDTIYIYKERMRERYKYLRDTIRLVKVDSVAVERIKEVKVEKPLSAFQLLKIRGFWPLLGLLALLLAWTIRKPLIKLLKL